MFDLHSSSRPTVSDALRKESAVVNVWIFSEKMMIRNTEVTKKGFQIHYHTVHEIFVRSFGFQVQALTIFPPLVRTYIQLVIEGYK